MNTNANLSMGILNNDRWVIVRVPKKHIKVSLKSLDLFITWPIFVVWRSYLVDQGRLLFPWPLQIYKQIYKELFFKDDQVFCTWKSVKTSENTGLSCQLAIENIIVHEK